MRIWAPRTPQCGPNRNWCPTANADADIEDTRSFVPWCSTAARDRCSATDDFAIPAGIVTTVTLTCSIVAAERSAAFRDWRHPANADTYTGRTAAAAVTIAVMR